MTSIDIESYDDLFELLEDAWHALVRTQDGLMLAHCGEDDWWGLRPLWEDEDAPEGAQAKVTVMSDPSLYPVQLIWSDAQSSVHERCDVSAMHDALTSVLHLHSPWRRGSYGLVCSSCRDHTFENEPTPWPCETVRSIRDAGIEVAP